MNLGNNAVANTVTSTNCPIVEKSRNQLRIQESLTLSQEMDLAPGWIEVDAKQFAGTLKALPERSDLPSDINESLIVELYSK